MSQMPNFFPALPEIFLLISTCVLMIVDLSAKTIRRQRTYVLAHIVLLGCAFLTYYTTLDVISPRPIYTFSDLFVNDLMSGWLKMAAYIAVGTTLVYSRQYLIDRGLMRGEFIVLLLFALLGMMILMSANSLLTVYLGLELLSLCQYALVALNRDSAASTEAAMKYFVLGALASGMLLYGMSMIYGATGTLTITEISHRVGVLAGNTGDRTLLVFGLVFLVAGIAFKLGVVPFHMWVPDVYQGAATAVTLVIASAPKLAAFAMAMRLLVNGLLDLAVDWQQMLSILAVLSMALGNITAIAQTNLKRMLAYSTISHMGFVLLGLAGGMVNGNLLNAGDAYSSAMFYVVIYVLTTLASFGMLLLLSRAGVECESLDDLKGLNQRAPWFALIMLIVMFSLAGVPPAAGFYAKLAILKTTVAAGQIGLAVAAVLFSLIGAFYYLRIVKLMYFDDASKSEPVTAHADMRVLVSVNGLALLALGILPQSLMALCVASIKAL